jgi:hypothetical protein
MSRAQVICAILYCLVCGTMTGIAFGQNNSLLPINPYMHVTSPTGASQPEPKAQAKILGQYGKLPLSFEANQGQADERVKFLSNANGYSLFLTSEEAVLVLPRGNKYSRAEGQDMSQSASMPAGVLRMKIQNSNPATKITGLDELMGKSNYFIGNDPEVWRTDVPNYAKVKYEEIYPGIDLVYYGNQRQLEYDFVVKPGSDPSTICIRFTGARKIKLDKATGDLLIKTNGSLVRFGKPVIYQVQKERDRVRIDGHYKLNGNHNVVFDVPHYDKTQPLVIDPNLTVAYSTYLGGSSADGGTGIAVDSSGNAYVTGDTASANFPTTPGAFQTSYSGIQFYGFVTKLNPAGNALLYSTYLGANNLVNPLNIAVDSSGNAYVSGVTFATNFPTTTGAFQTTFGGGESDAFVTKLNPEGSALIYSTYLGGGGNESAAGIALDTADNAYVTGSTNSSNFPISPGAFQATCSNGCTAGDVFVTSLNQAGSALVYSTYLGGSNSDSATGVTVNANGNAYVVGTTQSPDFPTTPGAFATTCDNCGPGTDPHDHPLTDVFVTEFNPAGSALVYSTFLGGSDGDFSAGIAIDASGNAYVTGTTYSANFPITSTALQTACGGGNCGIGEMFLTELNPPGSQLLYSTYFGGSRYDVGVGVTVDSSGIVYVAGYTESQDFPVTPAAFQTSCPTCRNDNGNAFVVKLNLSDSTLIYSSYLGGKSEQAAKSVALDSSDGIYLAGNTYSSNFPTTAGAFQTTYGGESDAFVTKFGNCPSIESLTVTPKSLGFPAEALGVQSQPKNVVLQTNKCNATPLTYTVDVTGDFAQTNNCGSSIAAGATCTIAVTFTPSGYGRQTGTLSLTDNAAGSPQTVSLSGTGPRFTVTASPTTEMVAQGQVATYTLTISPLNGFNQTILLSCVAHPKNSTCAISPSSVTLDGVDSVNATATVTTTGMTPTGTFNVSFQGKSGTLAGDASAKLTVAAN